MWQQLTKTPTSKLNAIDVAHVKSKNKICNVQELEI